MKFHIQTLGCKVNQYESQALETILSSRGHELSEIKNADAIIINTCSVTAESDRKSRQTIRRMKKQNPNAIIAVCGCSSQITPDDAEKIGAELVRGSGNRMGFADDLEKVFREKITLSGVDDALKRTGFEILPAGGLSGRTRAMMKIQDGCSNFCTYCIIPYSRGLSRSLPLDEAAKQAKQLAAEGYREFIITGIEIASYGRDLSPQVTLADVIKTIAENAPEVRLRLGSLEPGVITEDFARIASQIENLCPHFHLSMQSGCDETLRRMNRKYDTARFYESVSVLRKYFPGCAIGTDMITGFPGETDDEFAKTCDFIRKCNFAFMHIFPYSERPGTVAEKLPNQIEKAVKKERAEKAAVIADEMAEKYLKSNVGKTFKVLFEQEKGGISYGHAENYCEVAVMGTGLHNKVCEVLVNKAENGTLSCELVL